VSNTCTSSSDCGHLDLFDCIGNICQCSKSYGFRGKSCLDPTYSSMICLYIYVAGTFIAANLFKKSVNISMTRFRWTMNLKKINAKNSCIILLILSHLGVIGLCTNGILVNVGSYSFHEIGYHMSIPVKVFVYLCLSLLPLIVGHGWCEVYVRTKHGTKSRYIKRYRRYAVCFYIIFVCVASFRAFFGGKFEAIIIRCSELAVVNVFALCSGLMLSKIMCGPNRSEMVRNQGYKIHRAACDIGSRVYLILSVMLLQFLLSPMNCYQIALTDICLTFAILLYHKILCRYMTTGRGTEEMALRYMFPANIQRGSSNRPTILVGVRCSQQRTMTSSVVSPASTYSTSHFSRLSSSRVSRRHI